MSTGGGIAPLLSTAAVYLGASVASVALFRRLGLGSILGYLTAGAVAGPAGLGLVEPGVAIGHVAEFGVVLLLFVIGLEMQPSRLWKMRHEILGLGAFQLMATGTVLALILWALGLSIGGAFLTGLSLALSSTAFGVQILRERQALSTPYGRRAFAILLFQDMAVVPLLALAAVLAPFGSDAGFTASGALWAGGALVLLVVGGRYGLPWLFRGLAFAGADEAFTAAALLVVVGAALMMESAGLSMALGAFLAGVMLAETEFRHQLETDIEPFRSIFLGLFFISVGFSVNWGLAFENITLVLGGGLVLFALKAAVLQRLCALRGSSLSESLRVAATLGQAGEFAFVLLAIAADSWLITRRDGALLTAVIAVSMALTPLAVLLVERFLRWREKHVQSEGLERPREAGPGSVIVAGFGRSGQIVARMLRMRGYDLVLIDNSPTRIRLARALGSQVYFGDGSRLDVLTMAGAKNAKAIFLCINDRTGAQRAVSRLRERFPDKLILSLTYDRFSLIEMRNAGVDCAIREVFESSVAMARRGLELMGDDKELDALVEEFRRRDEELVRLQIEYGAHEAVQKQREKYQIKDRR